MSDEPEEAFGVWVLKQRESLGISRKALGAKIGVSAEYIRLLETEKRSPPSNPVRVALEAALNSEDDLTELIYKAMIQYGTGEPEFAKTLASKIIKAGYRKYV